MTLSPNFCVSAFPYFLSLSLSVVFFLNHMTLSKPRSCIWDVLSSFKCTPQSNPSWNIIPVTQSRALWEMSAHMWGGGHAAASGERERESAYEYTQCIWIPLTLYACFFFFFVIAGLNYLNRIWTSAPGWGCHGYWAPTVCLPRSLSLSVSLSSSHTHIRASERARVLKIWRCEFAEIPGKEKILCCCRRRSIKLQLRGGRVI